MMSNCDNCIFRGQWCEKENKCPLFKEDPELEKERIAMDREKVIKGLEEISDYFFDIYRNDTDSYKCEKAQEYSDVAIDALALINEQQKQIDVLESLRRIEQEGRELDA